MTGSDPDTQVASLLDEIAPGIPRADAVEAIARLRAGLDTSSRNALRRSLVDLPRALPQAYREIVTVLLRHALIRRYEAAGHTMHKSVRAQEDLRLLDLEQIESRLRNIDDRPELEEETREGLRILGRELQKPGVSVLELGQASAKLLPDHVSSFHLGFCWLHDGNSKRALELLVPITNSHASSRTKSYAWQAIAYLYWLTGDFEEARRASRRSAAAGSDRPGPAANWFVSSCYSGELVEALDAADVLDEMIDVDSPALYSYLQCFEQLIKRLDTPRDRLREMQSRVGPVSQRILDAIA